MNIRLAACAKILDLPPKAWSTRRMRYAGTHTLAYTHTQDSCKYASSSTWLNSFRRFINCHICAV